MGNQGLMVQRRTPEKRIIYLDVVKCLALLCVVTIHLVAYGVTRHPVGSPIWIRANYINGPVHVAVPLFVMVSGALLLKPERQGDWKSFLKRIVRIIVAFVFWSLIYAAAACITQDVGPMSFVWRLVTGEYHLWFLFMVATLYALAPLLCSIANSDYAWYAIGLCFLSTLLHTASSFLVDVPVLSKIALVFGSWVTDMRFDAGMLGYFLLGRRIFNMQGPLSHPLNVVWGGGTSGGRRHHDIWNVADQYQSGEHQRVLLSSGIARNHPYGSFDIHAFEIPLVKSALKESLPEMDS